MDVIKPMHHGRRASEAAVYVVEPYVVFADVYSACSRIPFQTRPTWRPHLGLASTLLSEYD